MQLTNNELLEISGGGFSIITGIGALITFIIGFVDGYIKPSKCDKWY